MQAVLAHLDAVIRILDAAADLDAIRPKVPRNARSCVSRGELFRLVMDEPAEPGTAESPTSRGQLTNWLSKRM